MVLSACRQWEGGKCLTVREDELLYTIIAWLNDKTVQAGGAVGLLIRTPGIIWDLFHGENLIVLLFTALLTAGVCAVFGYFALSLSMLGGVMKGCLKQAPRAAGLMGARKKLTEIMKPFDPGFTFEYFFGKVQALVKILIFTDDRGGLAVYEGKLEDCCFDNIIDAQFDGAVSLCGASFDATRERFCPYCRSPYDLKEDDWVITYIRKR